MTEAVNLMDTAYWVDSHCHLDFPDFDTANGGEGVDALIDRARLNRVGAMLTISTHTQRLARYVAIAERFDNVWTTVGVHPHQSGEAVETDITTQALIDMAISHSKIVGIGECGLDYHYDYASKDVQKRVFRAHLDAAIATGLPIIIHARQADEDIITCLKEALEAGGGKPLRGLLHCFSSGRALADYAVSIGLYVSFSGIVTFPKSHDIQEICKSIPLNQLLVETDAPYLAPVPYRGKRNEPAFVSHTGRFVAQLHNLDEHNAAHQTTDNFYRLFNKIGK